MVKLYSEDKILLDFGMCERGSKSIESVFKFY